MNSILKHNLKHRLGHYCEKTIDFLIETMIKFNSATQNLLKGKIINRYTLTHHFNSPSKTAENLKSGINELFTSQFEEMNKSIFVHQKQTTTKEKAKSFLNDKDYYLNEYFKSVSFQELLEEYNFRYNYWKSNLTK